MNVKCGTYDTVTGECKEGYMDAGILKYRPYPWYKRIWFKLKHNWSYKPPTEKICKTAIEYIGTTKLYHGMIWSKHRTYFDAAVYRIYSLEDGGTLMLYSDVNNHGRIYFNVDAYKQDNILILI